MPERPEGLLCQQQQREELDAQCTRADPATMGAEASVCCAAQDTTRGPTMGRSAAHRLNGVTFPNERPRQQQRPHSHDRPAAEAGEDLSRTSTVSPTLGGIKLIGLAAAGEESAVGVIADERPAARPLCVPCE